LSKRKRLLTAGLVSLVLFIVNTVLVLSGTTQSLDTSLALSINNFNLGSVVTEIMVLASQYGREIVWTLVVGIMVLLGKRETRLLGLELGVLFLVGIVAGDVMKTVWFRPRPFDPASGLGGIIARIGLETDSSYPSGHALIVSIGAVFCLLKFSRKWLAGVLAVEAALVCYSRIYLGAHYPLDVLGSVFAACSIVSFGVLVLERFASELGSMVDYVLGKLLGDGWVKL
jgi:membrane-associated phospholipid phosphatase